MWARAETALPMIVLRELLTAVKAALTVARTTRWAACRQRSTASVCSPKLQFETVYWTGKLTNGASPSGSVTFTANGATITGCAAVALAGSGNARTASCTTSTLAVGTHGIVARYGGDASNAASTSATLSQTINTVATGAINVALASNGATASASSTLSANYAASSLINNERKGANFGGAGGGWRDANPGVFPDWVQVDFSGSRTIDRVVVYSVQNNWTNPVEPTDTTTASVYGIRNFTVQGWSGSAWVTLATVSANTLAKRTVTFPAYTTDRIRINVTATADGWTRITEVEAWGTNSATTASNVALASNGGTASASSTLSANYAASSLINNERKGANFGGAGGGWRDANPGVFPDWVQVDFSGSRTIDRVVVYSVQNNWTNPVEPTDTTTASVYGIRNFTVQGWSGSAWVTLATVSANTLAKRTVTFPAYTTDRIRINVTATADGWTRITEVEAWGR